MSRIPPGTFAPPVGAQRERASRWLVAGVVVWAILTALAVTYISGTWLATQGAHRQVDPQARPVCAAVAP